MKKAFFQTLLLCKFKKKVLILNPTLLKEHSSVYGKYCLWYWWGPRKGLIRNKEHFYASKKINIVILQKWENSWQVFLASLFVWAKFSFWECYLNCANNAGLLDVVVHIFVMVSTKSTKKGALHSTYYVLTLYYTQFSCQGKLDF